MSQLVKKIKYCDICTTHLPYPPKPLVQFQKNSRILIIGQAPGEATHHSGTPWDDKSGERLKAWLGVENKDFYNPSLFALVPMGFCFPGKGKTGDLPPRPECAPQWMPKIRNFLKQVECEIYIGKYACDYHFDKYKNLTSLIQKQSTRMGNRIVLPHPSPRNNIWLKKNPWFESTTIKKLQKKIRRILGAVFIVSSHTFWQLV